MYCVEDVIKHLNKSPPGGEGKGGGGQADPPPHFPAYLYSNV
jgi:hypothetical protein